MRYINIRQLNPEERAEIYGGSRQALFSGLGINARRYLQKRGIDTETIAKFKLGFIPEEVELKKGNRGECLKDRLVIPIFNCYDELLCLSVRPIIDDKELLKEYIKYWNEAYDKGFHLFGLNVAKLPIVQKGYIIIVEGQLDCISMHAAGFDNCVALCGAAFTPFQASLIKRWTNQVVLMLDNDEAGKKNAVKAMDFLRYYQQRSVWNGNQITSALTAINITVPSEKDPNEFIMKNGAKPLNDFIRQQMLKNKMEIK